MRSSRIHIVTRKMVRVVPHIPKVEIVNLCRAESLAYAAVVL